MRPWLALAVAPFLTSAADHECHRDFTVNLNDNATKLFESCTTIVGNIGIGRGFDGDLNLRDLYNVTGTIDFYADPKHDSRPVVMSFNAPDLFHLGGLKIHPGVSVYELDLRGVETIGNVSIYVDEYALNLDLESLVEADSINISRALSTVDLANLKTVHGALTIDYHPANDSSNEPSGSNHGRIDLFSLETVGALKLAGATENMTLPRLRSVSESGLTLNMERMEQPFQLDLPRLQSVHDSLNLYGNIKGIHAPQLTNFTSINVTSSANLDCDAVLAAIEKTSGHPQHGSSVNCTSTPAKGLGKGAKIAIGVVVPVVVIAIAVGIALVCTKKRSRRESQARMELRGLPVDVTEQEPPPPYSPPER